MFSWFPRFFVIVSEVISWSLVHSFIQHLKIITVSDDVHWKVWMHFISRALCHLDSSLLSQSVVAWPHEAITQLTLFTHPDPFCLHFSPSLYLRLISTKLLNMSQVSYFAPFPSLPFGTFQPWTNLFTYFLLSHMDTECCWGNHTTGPVGAISLWSSPLCLAQLKTFL